MSFNKDWFEIARAKGLEITEGGAVQLPVASPLPEMSEKDFQAQVVKYAKEQEWLCYHTHDSRKSEPGFPDLVLVRERIIFAELKKDSGKLTDAQLKWHQALAAAGAEVYLWRPITWRFIVLTLERKEK